MREIQMVDLKKQYQHIKSEVDAAIGEVLENAAFINGGKVKEFATALSEYLGVKHVIPCANGTDALQIAMMALGLKPGDEVITPSFTYVATAEVIALLGLTPVFVDVDADTFCIDPEAVKAAIGPKTKAIVPVHLYGQSANMEAIMTIAREHELFVIEDNAQAIGADYTFSNGTVKKTGTIGTIGCTSFFPSKNLGCYGDGGAIFTNDDALAEKLQMIANHGQKKRYYHEVVGCNSRLDTLQAAVLHIKLPRLDSYNAARRKVAETYNEAFANHPLVQTPVVAAFTNHVYHQYTLVLKPEENAEVFRDGLVNHLAANQIPSMIYYPVPCHRQNMFTAFHLPAFDLTKTEWLTQRVVSLPVHTEMEAEQQNHIIQTVLNYLNQKS